MIQLRVKGCALEVCHGDLLVQPVDVLVCPTTEDLAFDLGVAGEVAKAAGTAFTSTAKLKAPLPLGAVVSCPPGNLPVRNIFVAAVTPKGSVPDRTAILNATRNTLFLAEQERHKTIALPRLGSVTTKPPYDTYGHLMLHTILEILTGQAVTLERVICCLYNRTAYQSFVNQLAVLRQEFLV